MKEKEIDLTTFDKDEIDDIEKTLFVTVIPTQNCDLRCWYCDVVDFTHKHRYITTDDYYRIIDFIRAQNSHNIVVRFYGGEPFIHPNIYNFFEITRNTLSDKNLDILVTTNLMKSYENYDVDVVLAPSFHSDYADPNKWFDTCYKLKDKIHHISLMLQDNNGDLIAELYDRHKDTLPVVIVPIDQYIPTDNYKKFKKSHPDMFIDDTEYVIFYGKETSYDHIMCSSGYIIDEDGELYYCWSRYDEPIMNVFNELKSLPKWHICNKYCDDCDQEVIRSTIEHYTRNLKDKQYNKNKNKKVLFRCNG